MLIFFTAYLLSFSHYGINLWDEGVMYAGGMRYFEGQRVMVDFFGYPPGRYIVVESIFRIFGFDMMPVRYFFTLFGSLLVFFAFHISRRIMPPAYALAVMLLVISSPAVYYQRFYALIFLFNAWAALVYLEDRRNAIWVAAAAVSAFLFRIELLMFFIPMYAYLLSDTFDGRKKVLYALGILATGILALATSPFGNVLTGIPAEIKVWGNPFPLPWEGYQGKEFGFSAFLENLLFYLPFLSAATLGYLALSVEERGRKRPLLVLAYLQLCAMSLIVARAGFDNLIRCLPLFYIVAAYLAYRLVKKLDNPPVKRAVVAFLALVWISYIFDLNANNGFYTGSVGAVWKAGGQVTRGRAAGIRTYGGDAAIIESLTDWIESETSPDDSIFAVPLNPIWYYLSDRKNPTYYDWILPSTVRNDKDEEKLLRQLDKGPPKMVIFFDLAIDNKEERRLKNYAPLLVKWVNDNYIYKGHVSNFQVWVRKT